MVKVRENSVLNQGDYTFPRMDFDVNNSILTNNTKASIYIMIQEWFPIRQYVYMSKNKRKEIIERVEEPTKKGENITKNSTPKMNEFKGI